MPLNPDNFDEIEGGDGDKVNRKIDCGCGVFGWDPDERDEWSRTDADDCDDYFNPLDY